MHGVRTWNAAAEFVRILSYQIIIDAVFERTKHDYWPSIFHYHSKHTRNLESPHLRIHPPTKEKELITTN